MGDTRCKQGGLRSDNMGSDAEFVFAEKVNEIQQSKIRDSDLK